VGNEPVRESRTNPFFAALLSLLWPGAGQLYNGSWRKALLFAAGALVLGVTVEPLMVSLQVALLNELPMAIGFAFKIAAIVDAVKDARTLGRGGRRWYCKGYACLGFALVGLLAFAATRRALQTSVVQPFHIPSGGMEPTILIGDHLLVDKLTYAVRSPLSGEVILRRREPRRGEIVVFLYPDDRARVFLKRVIGLPFETIDIRGKKVFVDGTPLPEPYAQFMSEAPEPAGASEWLPATVPADHLFVLGDNRDNSHDSRSWGFLPIDDVLGEAKMVYYSIGNERNAPRWLFLSQVRWLRFGKTLDEDDR
jgi:signal peptidase I